jgi:hypothetical protein
MRPREKSSENEGRPPTPLPLQMGGGRFPPQILEPLMARVSNTPGNPGILLEFFLPPGNPGNLLEF